MDSQIDLARLRRAEDLRLAAAPRVARRRRRTVATWTAAAASLTSRRARYGRTPAPSCAVC